MAEPTVTFGVYDVAKPFGSLSGWSLTAKETTTASERISAYDNVGNETISKLIDERTSWSVTGEASTNSAPSLPTTIGAVDDAAYGVLTSLSITTDRNAYATFSAELHQHTVNPHADTLQKAAHGIALSSGFGATDFIGLTTGTDASVQSGEVTVECDHIDETDEAGDHFVGQNLTGKITATTVYTGEPSGTTASGWDITERKVGVDNRGFVTTTVTATKALALA